MKSTVEQYINKSEKWQKELHRLRTIILECDLNEEIKWGAPCYSYQKKNICIIGELKDCAVLGFFKGALLSDPEGIMIKPGENTQAARTIRFTRSKEILEMASILKAYIYEAIEIEKAGLKVSFKKAVEFDIPEEFQKKLDKSPALKKAYRALTPGRQRGYLLFFSAAKQSKTRESRIEKYIPQILEGKGINDR